MTVAAGSPAEPAWTAAAVARRIGVAPGTLRSWSRRYGIGPSAHTAGRHRRYTAADLAEIDAVRALVAQGVALSTAAETVLSHRRSSTTPSTTPSGACVRGGPSALVAAVEGLDSATAAAMVSEALAAHGVLATWEELCRPAFAALDVPAARGRGCTDAQLLLSWVVTTCLRRSSPHPSAAPGRAVLLACAARDQHALPLEALFAALVEQQVQAVMLGPAVPVAALRNAARRLRPAAVVVSSHCAGTARPALLAELVGYAGTAIAAGPGWTDLPLPTSVLRADSLQVGLALTTAAAQQWDTG